MIIHPTAAWSRFFRLAKSLQGTISDDTPDFIPSLFSSPADLAGERARFRTRRIEAGTASTVLHTAIVVILAFLVVRPAVPPVARQTIVQIGQAMELPFGFDDVGGGGGGGGGDVLPPSHGRLPSPGVIPVVPPEPAEPTPLIPTEDPSALTAGIQLQLTIPSDPSEPIGDITAPPSAASRSAGPGAGGLFGTGRGGGVGPGDGPGGGPGSKGGAGGADSGGVRAPGGPYAVGGGVKAPVAVLQPLPAYTEEARKARTEGVVLVQAIIRSDGTVDSFRIVRGLGHGLDESAIQTIASKWRFRPGSIDGRPVDVIANIEVSFRLH